MRRQFLGYAWGLVVVAGLLGVWSKTLAARSAIALAEKTQEEVLVPKIIGEEPGGTEALVADGLSLASLALALTALASLVAARWPRANANAVASRTGRLLWTLAAAGAIGEVLLALIAV